MKPDMYIITFPSSRTGCCSLWTDGLSFTTKCHLSSSSNPIRICSLHHGKAHHCLSHLMILYSTIHFLIHLLLSLYLNSLFLFLMSQRFLFPQWSCLLPWFDLLQDLIISYRTYSSHRQGQYFLCQNPNFLNVQFISLRYVHLPSYTFYLVAPSPFHLFLYLYFLVILLSNKARLRNRYFPYDSTVSQN